MAISEARHRANEKYNAKAYDEIKIRVQKGQKEVIQALAIKQGESVNEYMKDYLTLSLPLRNQPLSFPTNISSPAGQLQRYGIQFPTGSKAV